MWLDWNSNGKHDAGDYLINQMMEKDAKKNEPTVSHYKKSKPQPKEPSTSNGDSSWGWVQTIAVIIIIIWVIYVACGGTVNDW